MVGLFQQWLRIFVLNQLLQGHASKTSLYLQHVLWLSSRFRASSVDALLQQLLAYEKIVSAVAEGLPPGADDATLAPQIQDAEKYEAEFVLPADPADWQVQTRYMKLFFSMRGLSTENACIPVTLGGAQHHGYHDAPSSLLH